MAKRIFTKNDVSTEQKVIALLNNTEQVGDCRVWVRCFNSDGYPHMFGNIKVHRLMYELSHNEDITGWVIRHTCDNPKCINPNHLLKGTQNDNNKDMVVRNRYHRVITKEIVSRTKALLALKFLTQKQIAKILNIDARRVSDISCGKYSDEGKFLGR